MKTLLLILIFAYLAYAVAMVWLHPRFIYPFQPDDVVLTGFSRAELRGSDGTPVFIQELPGAGPVLLYFMGNAGALALFESAFDRHRSEGRHIIALEFRGGAGRPGVPSETVLKADALAASDYALATGKPVVVQGFSLGTGLATHVSARRNVAGVILAAPYDRLCRLMAAASYLPACLLPVQRWNSLEDAETAAAPQLILHGSDDRLIPAHSSAPFENIQNVRRLVIPGAAHNDIGTFPAFHDEIEAFIAAQGL